MTNSERWLNLKRIASDALELPAASRADFLVGSCPDALRRDAQELLRTCERVSSTPTLLDTPATEFAAPIIANVEQNPIDLVALQAELAGRYTIERELGRGGMATVYLVYDVRHRRRVALKVVHSSPGHPAEASAARFQREIEIAARLAHPHILPLHDSGTTAAGLYYVMPFVPGESLRKRIARGGALSVQDTLRIARDVARALAYAHRHGIVHRDIKPDNILLNQDGDALVADFGVASALAAASIDGAPGHESADLAFCTPAYSAPEHLCGASEPDQRADLYSFGVTMHEMLSGARPLASPAQQTDALASLVTRRPNVPPTLAALIERLLAHDPAGRPRDATEVLRVLDTVITSEVAVTGAAPAASRARRRVVALASAASFALIGMFTRMAPRSSVRSLKCDNNNLDASQAYQRGKALGEDLSPGGLQAALNQFLKAVRIDSTFACGWAGLANVYTYQALFSEPADDAMAKARAALTRALALDSNLVEARTVRAHQLFVVECRRDDAEKEFARIFALDSTYAPAHRLYGWLLHLTHRNDQALEQLRYARNLGRVLPGAETLLGRVFVNLHQPDSAIRYLNSALEFNGDNAMAYEQMALAWLEKSDTGQAIATMRHAAEKNWRDSAQLAYVYARTGNGADGRRILRRLVRTESRRRAPVAGMVMAYAALGDADEAFRRLEAGSCLFGLDAAAGYESLRPDARFADLVRRKGL